MEISKQLDRIERYSMLAAKNVLVLDDVVILTGLSKSHLYKLTYTRQIPHYKPNGKQIYFDRAYSGGYPFSISGDIRSVPS